ncbi:tetratricopeptide repeat protein [Mastigocladus laminosus UU774]|nr:tetratricopeptide repeat protein [Mastigocladus laminosus UU774]
MKEILEKIDQLNREVVQLAGQGKFEQAIIVAQEAIKIGRKNLYKHKSFADSLNNLAELYRMLGYFSQARPLYIEALNLRKELLGDSHPDIAQALNNLGAFYVAQGLYFQAETYLFAALDIFKLNLGDEHEQIANYLNNIGEVYREQGRFEDAEKMHLEALEMRKRLLGDSHVDIAQSLDNLAALYENQARYADAEKMHLSALAMRKDLLGDEHWYIAVSLNNLAALYHSQGLYSQAEENYSQALELSKKCLGEQHPYVAITLNNLANTYNDQGRYADAENMHLTALAIRKKLFGDENLEVAQSLSNLGDIYLLQGRYVEAEQVYVEAHSIRQSSLTPKHPDIALSLHNLAVLYAYQGRYQAAEEKYLSALLLYKNIYGKNHPSVADNLNHLGGLYKEQGRFSDAEQKYLEALAIRKNLFGQEHPDIADSFNRIAEIYRLQGRYSQAEEIYHEAYLLSKRLLGEMHPDVAAYLNNLGVLYDAQFKYSQAEQLFLKVLLIVKNQFGNKHPQVASTMNNLATTYGSLGRYDQAEQMHFEVLDIRKSLLGQEHPDIANTLNNLAEIYLSGGRYLEAEQYYTAALLMRKSLLGDHHPDVAFSLNNLATLLAATQRFDDALSCRLQASEINDKLISNVFAFSSENDRIAWIEKIRGNFDLFLSLIYKHLPNSKYALQQALDFVLKRKALTSASLAAQNEALASDRYPHLQEQFRQLSDLNAQLVKLTFSTPQINDFTNYQQELAELEARYNHLQKQLASQVPEIQLTEKLADRFAVAEALPTNSILVEFVRFDVYDFHAVPAREQTQWHPARYLAFILPAQQPHAVQMIDLGEAEVIDELISLLRSLACNPTKETLAWGKVSTTPKLQIKQYDPTLAIQLRNVLFAPICELVQGYKHLILAPDGNLNLLPFQILPTDETGTHLLMDEYTISYLGVGRDILRSRVQTIRAADAPIIMADPDFDLVSEQRIGEVGLGGEGGQGGQEFIDTLGGEVLSRAPGTRFLGESVAKKLPDARLYVGAEALESSLISSKCPKFMLIATHGLFLPDSPQQPPTQHSINPKSIIQNLKSTNPMMRSGLALAGANTWLKNGTLPQKAGKGFVFAQEIASLDLWANELTVLSACDTARGDIKIGEGVFGLRRAFTVAGAKTLVMSLWKVPDRATALLMDRFFDNLQDGMGYTEALQNAQNYIRRITVKELRESALGMEVLKELLGVRELLPETKIDCQQEDTPLEHPFYWGAWICQTSEK